MPEQEPSLEADIRVAEEAVRDGWPDQEFWIRLLDIYRALERAARDAEAEEER